MSTTSMTNIIVATDQISSVVIVEITHVVTLLVYSSESNLFYKIQLHVRFPPKFLWMHLRKKMHEKF
jgi:hypothetical protein